MAVTVVAEVGGDGDGDCCDPGDGEDDSNITEDSPAAIYGPLSATGVTSQSPRLASRHVLMRQWELPSKHTVTVTAAAEGPSTRGVVPGTLDSLCDEIQRVRRRRSVVPSAREQLCGKEP